MILSFLNFFPINKAVNVIGKKSKKADNDGKTGDLCPACKRPEKDQDHIIGGIGNCKVRAAPEGQIDSNKACRHGQGTRKQIGGTKIF